jgi:hypothetical protein
MSNENKFPLKKIVNTEQEKTTAEREKYSKAKHAL